MVALDVGDLLYCCVVPACHSPAMRTDEDVDVLLLHLFHC